MEVEHSQPGVNLWFQPPPEYDFKCKVSEFEYHWKNKIKKKPCPVHLYTTSQKFRYILMI